MSDHLFGLKYPIVQAPVGSAAGPELCAAVAAAGGMGAMALTWRAPKVAQRFIEQVKGSTDGPFLVNFVLAFPPLCLETALDAGTPFVTFSWGDPSPYVDRVRKAGARFGVQVGNVHGARHALDIGADFILCQGLEAGGHVQSSLPRDELLREVVAIAGDTPAVAAGGIGDGRGIAKALKAGAAGAMLGTRFVATQESQAHPLYKEQIVKSTAADTALTVCFEGGWPHAPHRVLRNRTLDIWEAAGCPAPGSRPGEGDVVAETSGGGPILRYEDALPRSDMSGALLDMPLYAGTSCELIHDIPSAADLLMRLWKEAADERSAR